MTTIKVLIGAVAAFLLFFGSLFFNVGNKEFQFGVYVGSLVLGLLASFLVVDWFKATFWPDSKHTPPAPKPKKKTRRRRRY